MSLWTPDGEHPVEPDDGGELSEDGFDDATRAEVEAQLAQAQAQLLAAPVDQVVSNHVMGLFELAALHLRVEDPDLDAARLPIDAMGLLVDNLGDRLADHETLSAALTQLRMAYVQVKKAVDTPDAEASGDETSADQTVADQTGADQTSADDSDAAGSGDDLIEESDFLD